MLMGRIVLCVAALTCAAALPALAQQRGLSDAASTLDLSRVFTFFFLMLGPIKTIVPFARQTKDAAPEEVRKLALKASAVSMISLLIAASIGVAVLKKWHVSVAALTMTAGVILFLVALQVVLKQYSPPGPPAASPPSGPTPGWVMSPLSFPTIVTPYGIATLIVLIAASQSFTRQLQILSLVGLVMLIDLLAMLYAQRILKFTGTAALQILSVVLGVLQVALGLELIILALTDLGIAHRV